MIVEISDKPNTHNTFYKFMIIKSLMQPTKPIVFQ